MLLYVQVWYRANNLEDDNFDEKICSFTEKKTETGISLLFLKIGQGSGGTFLLFLRCWNTSWSLILIMV